MINGKNILLISAKRHETITYKNSYIDFFSRTKNLMYMNVDDGNCVKTFCDKKLFRPDIILIDHHFANDYIFPTNGKFTLKQIHFNNSKIILHSHKEFMRHTWNSIKFFCNSHRIKNIFYINCFYEEETKKPIDFKKVFSGYNCHPLDYGFDIATFPDIQYKNVFEKTHDVVFAGVVGRPNDTIYARNELISKIEKLSNNHGYKNIFLRDKRFASVKEYSKAMSNSKICLDTQTAGGHAAARLWEIPLHKSALMVVEAQCYKNILNDGVNSIIIKKDLSDLEEKLSYYLNNDSALQKIIDTAYVEFLKKHTIEQRIRHMLERV